MTLLAIAALIGGYFAVVQLAAARRLDSTRAAEMMLAMIAAGIAGAHVFKFVYLPEVLAADPVAFLHRSAGIASFGGIFGGLAAGVLYVRIRRLETFRYLDLVAQVFPFAWIVGRTACFLTGDHPGIRTSSWLGVQFPDGRRYDLALIEMLFTAAIMVTWLALRRRPVPPGFYLAALLTSYGPFRFLLDGLHEAPPRYGGVPVDRLAACLLTIAGLALGSHVQVIRRIDGEVRGGNLRVKA